MIAAPKSFASSPEALVVGLARMGDRDAFSELVRRRQSWIRTLMRRCSGDVTVADDLSQQIFLQAWRDIRKLRQPKKFGAWLKRLAINTWLQHLRKHDPLVGAELYDEEPASVQSTGMSMDLDQALGALPNAVRTCVVLSYHEGMTHGEIADLTRLPAGTVKSHIRRGSQRLQQMLAAYQPGDT